MTCSRVVSSTL